MAEQRSIFSHSFGTTWRKALVSLPRLVPNQALYVTSPEGPQPFVLKVPSFHPGKPEIPCYVFLHAPSSLPVTQSAAAADHAAAASSSESTASNRHGQALRLPVLLDFHGGSFILGTPLEQAPFCAQMARELGAASGSGGGGCVAISVDYRLGPYAQYPAANEDAECILRAVLEPTTAPGKVLLDAVRARVSTAADVHVELDADRIAISGFSSGGNIALGLALSVQNDPTINRDWPSVIPEQHPRQLPLLLFYPSLDARLLPSERPRPPGLAEPKGFLARLRIESELMPTYLPASQRHHPRASPGLAPVDGLHPRAKILLVLPEFDSLSEQSMAWIDRLAQGGRSADLQVLHVPGVTHGWTQFPNAWLRGDDDVAKKAMVFAAARDFIQSVWASGG